MARGREHEQESEERFDRPHCGSVFGDQRRLSRGPSEALRQAYFLPRLWLLLTTSSATQKVPGAQASFDHLRQIISPDRPKETAIAKVGHPGNSVLNANSPHIPARHRESIIALPLSARHVEDVQVLDAHRANGIMRQ